MKVLNSKILHAESEQVFKKAFTLIEVLVYIAILAIIVSVVFSSFLWIGRSGTKTKAMREVLNNASLSMEKMTYEIREAKSVYSPTTDSVQLSLETTKYLPTGEEITYIDFYLCGTRLCFKKESYDTIALTSDKVEVKEINFAQIATTSTIPSVQISLVIDYKNPHNRPEYRASINLTSTASLRAY